MSCTCRVPTVFWRGPNGIWAYPPPMEFFLKLHPLRHFLGVMGEIGHSRFSQCPSLKKLLQQRFWYFSIPNDRKRSWENFEGMFPELFLRCMHKNEKKWQNDQISYFYLGFWFKIELFEGWYLKNSSGNMYPKFY